MAFRLTKAYPRLWSLDAGVAMVVTDLHGDRDAYARYRERFIELHAAGQADCPIVAGDLIHREPDPGQDRSLDMVLDILALRERYGDAIIYLCGNHELPHLYGFVLSKGDTEYTPGFEAALSESGRRDHILALFKSLLFFIRTVAGVTSRTPVRPRHWRIARRQSGCSIGITRCCAHGPRSGLTRATVPNCAAATPG